MQDEKKTIIIVLTLFVMIFIWVMPVMAGSGDKPDLTYLTLVNKTDGNASVQLVGDNFYYLTVGPGTIKTFHVEKGDYLITHYACGRSSSGVVNLHARLRLTYIACNRVAPNFGEPSEEKISFYDDNAGRQWRYQRFK